MGPKRFFTFFTMQIYIFVTLFANINNLFLIFLMIKAVFDTPVEVKSIVFDLGNVVLDIDIQKSVDAFKELNIAGLVSDNIFPSPLPIFENYERGELSSVEFLSKFRENYPSASKINDEKFWWAWNILFGKFEPKRIELIKKLSEEYSVYLLSNTNEEHVRFFKELYKKQFGEEFESLFVKSFYSNELLCRKPDRIIYEKVIAETGVNPSETLFIDDLQKNVEGARQCGLIAYHLVAGRETILDIFK